MLLIENRNYIIGPNWYIISPSDNELKIEQRRNRFKTSERICRICGVKFSHGRMPSNNCCICKIYIKCKLCGEYKLLNSNNKSGTAMNLLLGKLKDNLPIEQACSIECIRNNEQNEEHKESILISRVELLCLKYKFHGKLISYYKNIIGIKDSEIKEYFEGLESFLINKLQEKEDDENYIKSLKSILSKYKSDYKPKNILRAARIAGFKTGNNLEDIENFLESLDKDKQEKLEMQKLLDSYGRKDIKISGLVLASIQNGFVNKSSKLENIKDYLESLKEKSLEKEQKQKDFIKLTIKYDRVGMDYVGCLKAARRMGYTEKDELLSIELMFKQFKELEIEKQEYLSSIKRIISMNGMNSENFNSIMVAVSRKGYGDGIKGLKEYFDNKNKYDLEQAERIILEEGNKNLNIIRHAKLTKFKPILEKLNSKHNTNFSIRQLFYYMYQNDLDYNDETSYIIAYNIVKERYLNPLSKVFYKSRTLKLHEENIEEYNKILSMIKDINKISKIKELETSGIYVWFVRIPNELLNIPLIKLKTNYIVGESTTKVPLYVGMSASDCYARTIDHISDIYNFKDNWLFDFMYENNLSYEVEMLEEILKTSFESNNKFKKEIFKRERYYTIKLQSLSQDRLALTKDIISWLDIFKESSVLNIEFRINEVLRKN